MRVVAGTARGRRLGAPAGASTRPTSDRVREAVFNALGSLGAVEGAAVLDLFSGSGALAIEALSRGAVSAVLVESDRQARAAIAANLAATGFTDRAEVIGGDSASYLGGSAGPFALVLADPPYAFDGWEDLLAGVEAVLSPDGVVVAESAGPVRPVAGLEVVRARRYGGTVVTFFTRPVPGLDAPTGDNE